MEANKGMFVVVGGEAISIETKSDRQHARRLLQEVGTTEAVIWRKTEGGGVEKTEFTFSASTGT
jgi:hypothetical protein